jgi:hypothetical protein
MFGGSEDPRYILPDDAAGDPASTAARIAAADRSISSAVVDQFEIEMRIAACRCQFVPPTQQVPSCWTLVTTCCVMAAAAASLPLGVLNCTRTWECFRR